MSGTRGECKELKVEEGGFSSSALKPQDILLAHEILSHLCRPLSWKDLHDEFTKCGRGCDWQTLKDAFCNSNVKGFIVCEDFISLDTVEMIALLKLQLIIVIFEKLKRGQMCLTTFSFLVNATVSDEEQSYLGRNPTALAAKLVAKYQDILRLTGSILDAPSVASTTNKTLKFQSFFSQEKSNPMLSAIHKIKYFLNLCHGKSSTSSIFEFVQNFLTPDEKVSLGKTKDPCMRQIQVSQDDVKITGETVELLPPHRWHNQPRKAETFVTSLKMDGATVISDMNFPAAEQISLAKSILLERGKPLPWQEFTTEYSKIKPDCSTQTLQDTFCRANFAGLFSSRDFISLDTPQYIGLLKLQLIVEIQDRLNSRKFSKVHYKFFVTATKEERDFYGCTSDLLMKSMCDLPDVFCFSTSKDEVRLQMDYTPKQNSFFMYEGDDTKLSAIHKLKYFLYLNHGSSSDHAFFEFSRCLLTKEEKKHYSGNACEEVMELLKSLNDVFQVVGSTVKLVLRSRPKQQVQNYGKVGNMLPGPVGTSTKTNNLDGPEKDLQLFHEILQGGPLSWTEFADEYAKHKPGSNLKTLQERIYQSSPSGFAYSPDFISLDTPESIALLKLQLIVVADNRLQNGQLGKISYHFNIAATDQERKPFGKNSNKLSQSLQKYPHLFNVSPAGSAKRDVAPSSKTIPFHNFFSLEGRDEASLIHKLKYFLNLCGGLSSIFSVYEFARNILTSSEKSIFQCNENSLVKMLTDLKEHFHVSRDDIELQRSCLWDQEPKCTTNWSIRHQDYEGDGISQAKLPSLPQVGEVLTADFVKDVLSNHARYPMDWNEFKNKFMVSKQNADVMIANFVETFSKKALKYLCFSADFLALNTPFHRNRLKLQLLLAIRKKSTNPDAISLAELHEQLAEIASQQEIEQTELNCNDFRGFLEKFPKVFAIEKGNFVKQGRDALQFPSFFEHENDGPLISVVHKLNYFVYLCGDYCSIPFVCKFLQRHVSLKKELNLVNTDEKVIALIEKCENGNLVEEEDKETVDEPIESETETKAIAFERAAEIKAILKKVKYIMTWSCLESHCLAKNKSKEWVKEFKLKYLPALNDKEMLFSRDFIALNTYFSKAFLKLCLLVRLNVNKKGKYNHWTLFKQFHNIASCKERQHFMKDLPSHLKSYPSVFKLEEQKSGNYNVLPGEEMVPFEDFFICKEHEKADCIQCQFMYYLKICNGQCNYQKAQNFVQLVMNCNSKANKNVKTMSKKDAEDFIHRCDFVEQVGNSELQLIVNANTSPSSENSKHSDTNEVPSLPEKKQVSLQGATQGNSQLPSSAQVKTSCSTTEVDSQDDAFSKDSQPPVRSQEAESVSVNSAEVKLASSGNNSSSEINRLVKVEIVRTDKVLSQVIEHMLKFEGPIISMAYREDALVILNWEGKGFVVPFKKTNLTLSNDSAFAEKWSLLVEFFQNPTVIQVAFDCHAVGKFLLENFNLQLNDTVFDVKIGAELLPSECNPTSVNNVADLCRCLNLPSPDKVDVQTVGDLCPKKGEEMVTLEKSSVEAAVREASALIPGIYAKLFQSLQEINALQTLHSLTGDKLQSLYNMNIDSLLPLDQYYSSDLVDTEPMKQSSSQSSVSTASSAPVSSVSLPGLVSSQIPSVNPTNNRLPPSGSSEIKGSTDDWFSTDIGHLPTIPAGITDIFDENQFSGKSSLTGTSLISYLQNQSSYRESPIGQSLPQRFLSNQHPDFEQPLVQDHPFSLCKDESGSIIQVPVEEAGSYDQNLSGITEELVNNFTSQHKQSMLQLLLLLGIDIFETLRSHYKEDFCDSFYRLTDIVLDLGRNVEARFFRQTKDESPETVVASSREVSAKDLAEIGKTDLLTGFGDDNRCGVEGALHSLRQVKNKKKKMVGLTVRVHKPLVGCADMMYDVAVDGKCTLIIGYSGVGKTTLLRELARCLNDSARKRVIVIDTHNEIAGDYDVPHFSIGGARRLQVDSHENQHKTLLESAKNHNPEVLMVDEIENQNDVAAVVKLCQQGIQVIAGVDTESISSLFNDKNFHQLFQNGGNNHLDDSVSLDSAGALAKSKVRPSFQALVEMVGCHRWYVHDLAHTYNCCLSGQPYSVQERTRINFRPGHIGEQQIILQEKLITS